MHTLGNEMPHACTRLETKCLMHVHAWKRNASCMYTLGNGMSHETSHACEYSQIK